MDWFLASILQNILRHYKYTLQNKSIKKNQKYVHIDVKKYILDWISGTVRTVKNIYWNECRGCVNCQKYVFYWMLGLCALSKNIFLLLSNTLYIWRRKKCSSSSFWEVYHYLLVWNSRFVFNNSAAVGGEEGGRDQTNCRI